MYGALEPALKGHNKRAQRNALGTGIALGIPVSECECIAF
jgi:hypothetical protein